MAKRQDKQPWGKFYWSDWLSEPKLKMCSLSAQGLWMRMLCIAADANPVGYVIVEGQPLGATELAAECGKSIREVTSALAELQRWGVFSTDRRGRIYSRRMIQDVKKAKTARENGKNGGNPSLGKGEGNSPLDKGKDKPQKPEARTRTRRSPQTPQGALIEISEWSGPADVRAVVRRHYPREADAYLTRYCTWREIPDRALITTSATIHAKLRACEGDLKAAGWVLVLEQERVA
jgi:hypothetical protein